MSRDVLREEHDNLQRAVLESRRKALDAPTTHFVLAMRQVMDDYLGMRAAGVAREDAVKGVEDVLRDVWPHKPSKFGPACDECGDTGWRETTCWDRLRCGRERCANGHPGYEHFYVEACHCPKGDVKGKRNMNTPDAVAETMRATMTRKPKPKGFTRFSGPS